MRDTRRSNELASSKIRLGWVFASLGEALAVGVILLLIVCAGIYGIWQQAEQEALQSKRAELIRLASTLSSLVDGDLFDTFRDDKQTNTKEFDAAAAPLRKAFNSTPGIKFIYTTRIENGKIMFVVDPTMPGDHDGDGKEDQARVGEVYENNDPALAISLRSTAKPIATASDKPYTDVWGTFISGFAPYYRKDGSMAGVVGVDVDAKDFMLEQARRRNQALSGLVPAVGLSILLVGIVFLTRLSHRRVVAAAQAEYKQNLRLAEIARRTGNAVIVIGLDRRIEWVNEGFVRMTGYMSEEAIGQLYEGFGVGPDTDPAEVKRVTQSMDHVLRCETTLVKYRKDGAQYWAKVEVEPVFDTAGMHAGYMTIKSDISEERRLQESLSESEQRLSAMFSSMAEGVILRLADGKVAMVNQAAERILGLSKASLLGGFPEDSPLALTDSRGAPLHKDNLPSALSLRTGQSKHDFLCGLTRPDGSHRWIRVNTEVILGSESSIQGVVSTIADVTEVEQASRTLANERARLHDFVAHAPAAIAMLDRDYIYVAASERWEEMFGLTQGSAQGLNHFDACHESPASWYSAFHRCLDGAVVTCHDEEWRTRGGQATSHLWWESRPWHLSDGTVGGVLVSAMDITEQVEREQAIRDQAIQLAEMNEQLDTLATRDPLTNLYNRRRFMELVELTVATAKDGVTPGLLYLDLDNFKYVNDAMGHDAGDQLLKTVAERLTEVCGGAIVARLGGDEFAVLIPSTDLQSGGKVAARIVDRVTDPVELDGRELSTSFSVGLAISKGKSTVDTLLQQADMAMYYAKSEGKSCWKVFEDWMADETINRLQLEADMRQAWEKRQFEVYYQPLVEAATGNKVSAEALIRWKSDRRGLVGPDKFIPLLEEIGLIEQVGEWVLEEACRYTQELRSTVSPDLRVAVNVSGVQLKGMDYVAKVKRVLDATGLPPAALTLEITETVLVGSLDTFGPKCEALREMGIKLAVDDFGTGYSAMGMLASLPVDIVKIDKAFVHSVGDSLEAGAIIRALVTLCKVIGLTVVAEGVETESQFVQLHALGTDHCQGYFFSGPVDKAKYKKWLSGSLRAA
ncbi:MAG: EAL domain-containing protein [Armatimonadetes bacterium]|nr:EAL domain-containing protein [Armatimonadota bacterium]